MRQQVLQVCYSKRVKRIQLQRILVSRWAFQPEKLTMRDILTAVDNLVQLQDLARKDPGFREKYGLSLEVCTYIFKNKLKGQTYLNHVRVRYVSNLLKFNLGSFLIPERNIDNMYRSNSNYFELRRPQPLGIPNSQLPPEKYIGKGYTDKGTAKKPELDGSPRWQEIAAQPYGKLYEITK